MAYKIEGHETPQLEEISQIQWLNLEEAKKTVTYERDKEILKKVETESEKVFQSLKKSIILKSAWLSYYNEGQR